MFNEYQASDAVNAPERDVIPRPASVDFNGEIDFQASDWVVLNNSNVYAEVLLISDTLGVTIVDEAPATKYIELALSTQIPTIPCSGEEELHRIRVMSGEGNPQKIHLEAVTSTGLFYGIQTLRMLTKRGSLPLGTLTDCSRYSYRGVMVDVGRNFHSKESILALIKGMATYKLNKLHLHLTDDEGWRLEIPGLPELTQVGATRCHDTAAGNATHCILPQLGSSPDGGDQGSGYYTIEDYKEILRHANTHHIQVIPEFDVPGHAHAAIKAMEARAAGGDDSFLLSDPEDSSAYLSVQMFKDNAINPCIESTYTFMKHIVQQVKSMHQEIQPLSIFHFGGDEVATTAWTGSPECAGQSKVELKRNFTQRLSQDVAEEGLSLAAWEDGVADETSHPYDISILATDDVTAYAWSNIWEWGQGDRAYRLANAGYRVVLSHASHLYFDHPSEPDPEERGYYWAPRYTDTAKTFSYSPEDIYSNILTDRMGNALTKEGVCATHSCVSLDKPENIIGMQAQIWTETVRTREQMEQMLWPRMLAVAERAWYKASWEDITDDADERAKQLASDWTAFARAVAEIHLPVLEELGLNYTVRPPGVRLAESNTLDVLTEFPDMPTVFQTGESSQWTNLEPGHQFGSKETVRIAAQSFDRSSQSRPVEVTTSGSGMTRASIGTLLCFLLCIICNLV